MASQPAWYSIKEIFYSIQGEGANAGSPAVFVRFSGCNLWSGREEDRAVSCSAWCDTDFRGTDGENGGRYEATALAKRCAGLWPGTRGARFVVLTGGEPSLQVDGMLVEALRRFGFTIAAETNGVVPARAKVDWITVSPKAGTIVTVRAGDELKIVYPQDGLDPEEYVGCQFVYRFLQPKDGPDLAANTAACLAYCLADPRWRLSLQLHKQLGVR